MPLSPAESDKSVGKKEDPVVPPLKVKRNSMNKGVFERVPFLYDVGFLANNQRYSSDDLYKPRPTFASSRRRGAKNLEN